MKVHHGLHNNSLRQISLEVDLRSNESSKRTLNFFLGETLSDAFFTDLPPKVQFVVFFYNLLR